MFYFIEKPSTTMLISRFTPSHGVDSIGDGDNAWRGFVCCGAHLLQKLYRFQILLPAVDIRGPVALGT